MPRFQAYLSVIPRSGPREEYTPTLDTLYFEPDAERFTMSWRLSRPLRRDIFEVAQVVVGRAAPRVPGVVVRIPGSEESEPVAQPSGQAG